MDPADRGFVCIANFLERQEGAARGTLHLTRRPLRGGLEAVVEGVRARFVRRDGRPGAMTLVLKHLEGTSRREGDVYQQVASAYGPGISPRLLALDKSRSDRALLLLEWVHRSRRWPWQDLRINQHMLQQLAQLHGAGAAKPPPPVLRAWDYEAELTASAATTVEAVERCRFIPELTSLARGRPWLRRIVISLPRLRDQLLAFAPMGQVPIHGDLHPGNVVVRRRASSEQPMFVDWARARIGSPLEDVSGWLQSLGFWEPQARRRHDTLLGVYLAARGLQCGLNSQMRQAYWLAGASNALAGALRYHVALASDCRMGDVKRAAGLRAALAWMRILRRAAA